MHARALAELMREPLDVEATAPRIDGTARARLQLEEQLRVARDARRELGRECERFVERVRVERLRVALRRRHRFEASAGDVVVDVLRREAPAGGLTVRAQAARLVALR